MSHRTDSLLIALLVLLIGITPVGSAWAKAHACGSGSDTQVMAQGEDAAAHARHRMSDHTAIQDPAMQGCAGCDPDCCSAGVCANGHCSVGMAALFVPLMPADDYADGGAIVAIVPRVLCGRHSPPFRPPQA